MHSPGGCSGFAIASAVCLLASGVAVWCVCLVAGIRVMTYRFKRCPCAGRRLNGKHRNADASAKTRTPPATVPPHHQPRHPDRARGLATRPSPHQRPFPRPLRAFRRARGSPSTIRRMGVSPSLATLTFIVGLLAMKFPANAIPRSVPVGYGACGKTRLGGTECSRRCKDREASP